METKPIIYTKEYVEAEVKFLFEKVLKNEDLIYIGQLVDDRPYTRERLSEWARDFKDDDEIPHTIAKIKGIFETRAVVGGLKQKLNPAITKFHLINNFDWRDKTEVDHTTKGDKLDPYAGIAPEARAKMAAIYEEELKKQLIK